MVNDMILIGKFICIETGIDIAHHKIDVLNEDADEIDTSDIPLLSGTFQINKTNEIIHVVTFSQDVLEGLYKLLTYRKLSYITQEHNAIINAHCITTPAKSFFIIYDAMVITK